MYEFCVCILIVCSGFKLRAIHIEFRRWEYYIKAIKNEKENKIKIKI